MSSEGNNLVLDSTVTTASRKGLANGVSDLQFQFELDDLLRFIFPTNLQHPLTNARLFIFALYGPLDREGRLHSGRKGQHVLMEYELDEMCQQIEREDLIQVYMHRPRDMATLVTSEQDAIINQADAHLKRAKGRAMLPQLTRAEIIELFQSFARDSEGKISFHEAQAMLNQFRTDRVKQFKLVYPNLTNKNKSDSYQQNASQSGSMNTFQNQLANLTGNLSLGSLASSSLADSKNQKQKIVGPYIAPATMFQKNKGNNNADLVEVTMQQLTKHGNKIIDIDSKGTTHVISNIKLLREIPPNFENPYEGKREKWDATAGMKGSGIGSGVSTVPSSSTWKRKYTIY